MSNTRVVEFPNKYEAEIALAERSLDMVEERVDNGRLPDDAVPKGDVFSLLDAIGGLLHLEVLEDEGRHVSRKKTEGVVEQLRSAVGAIERWPLVPRALVIAPLVEMLEDVALQWLVLELMMMLPNVDFLEPQERQILTPAFRRIIPVHVEIVIDEDQWAPEFEEYLRVLRLLVLEDQEDDGLLLTLRRGIIFHAPRSREHIHVLRRRELVAAEPLPQGITDAIDELAGEAFDSEIIALSLHLVVADALAAGLIPEWAKPRHVAAAVFLALAARDAPEVKLDLLQFARRARLKPKILRKLKEEVDPAFDWLPPGSDETLFLRQSERWMTLSEQVEFMPVRWLPERAGDPPPYTTEAARKRLDELGDVAWMMVDGLEAVRFITEVFHFGDEAPDEIDEEIALKAIRLWKRDRLVDPEIMEEEFDLDAPANDDDSFGDIDPISGGEGRPQLVTTDGDPLVFCTTEYDFGPHDRAEIAKSLDAMAELEQEQDGEKQRWVWLDERGDELVLIATLRLEADRLWLETASVQRSARVGGRLAEKLGDLIILVDLETQVPTPEMLARHSAEAPGIAQQDGLPAELEGELIRKVLDEHYRRWPDEGVPALGGLTPREAVDDPEGRARVIALLRDFEARDVSAPEAMQGSDFGFLWDDLGLDRHET